MKRKLSSRKLWAAAVGVIVGVAMVFGLDQETISTVAGAVTAVASVIAYIVTEGRIDSAAIKHAADNVNAALDNVTSVSAIGFDCGDYDDGE